ncbi:hypothetical protein RsS62_38770 [Rhizobium dioscoreae]|nr:hypothetical protein RsS62_38770 [Rhizobium dioscoreae]
MSIPVSTVIIEDALFIERVVPFDWSEAKRKPWSTFGLPAFLFGVSVWVLACVIGLETLKSLRLSARRTWF